MCYCLCALLALWRLNDKYRYCKGAKQNEEPAPSLKYLTNWLKISCKNLRSSNNCVGRAQDFYCVNRVWRYDSGIASLLHSLSEMGLDVWFISLLECQVGKNNTSKVQTTFHVTRYSTYATCIDFCFHLCRFQLEYSVGGSGSYAPC